MIAHLQRASHTAGLLTYLYGPGERGDQSNPRLVGGDCHGAPIEMLTQADTLTYLAHALDATVERLGTRAPERPVWVCSVRSDPRHVARDGHWDGVLPELRLLVEWPEEAAAPTDYWLSNLPEGTPVAELVRLAKIRWRIEHDYRELKHGLGLDHFEGRSWTGWHHHVTLVTAAHAFLTEHRLSPKAHTPACPCTRSWTPSRTC